MPLETAPFTFLPTVEFQIWRFAMLSSYLKAVVVLNTTAFLMVTHAPP